MANWESNCGTKMLIGRSEVPSLGVTVHLALARTFFPSLTSSCTCKGNCSSKQPSCGTLFGEIPRPRPVHLAHVLQHGVPLTAVGFGSTVPRRKSHQLIEADAVLVPHPTPIHHVRSAVSPAGFFPRNRINSTLRLPCARRKDSRWPCPSCCMQKCLTNGSSNTVRTTGRRRDRSSNVCDFTSLILSACEVRSNAGLGGFYHVSMFSNAFSSTIAAVWSTRHCARLGATDHVAHRTQMKIRR